MKSRREREREREWLIPHDHVTRNINAFDKAGRARARASSTGL